MFIARLRPMTTGGDEATVNQAVKVHDSVALKDEGHGENPAALG